jgi:PhnB protein
MEGWAVHPLLAQLFIEDSDAFFNRAVEAGAKVTMPMTDMFFGHRAGHLIDPFGGTWIISTQKEIVAPEEIQRRIYQSVS